jgi:hypothetical protein
MRGSYRDFASEAARISDIAMIGFELGRDGRPGVVGIGKLDRERIVRGRVQAGVE